MPTHSDSWIDQQLRELPLPDGLHQRLHKIPDWPDEQIDSALGFVSVPVNLTDRCKAIVEDAGIEVQLRSVLPPSLLTEKLRAIPSWESSSGGRAKRRSSSVLRPLPAVIAATLLALLGGATLFNAIARFGRVAFDAQAAGLGDDPMSGVITDSSSQPLEIIELPLPQAHPNGNLDLTATLPLVGLAAESAQPEDAIDELRTFLAHQNPLAATRPLPEVVLGAAPTEHDQMPNLIVPAPSLRRGIHTALSPGVDRSSLFRHQVQPIVSLLGGDQLQSCEVPLWTSNDGYLHAEDMLRNGMLPKSWQIHVEDFLAALDYDFPIDDSPLSIHVLGGPNELFEASNQTSAASSFLLVGIQAGLPKRHRLPTTLTIAVDTSSSMLSRSSLSRIKQALRRVSKLLQSEDRINLIVFNQRANLVTENAMATEMPQLLERLDEFFETRSATNLAAGLDLAIETALQVGPQSSHRRSVLIISDDASDLPPPVQRFAAERLVEAKAAGIELTLLDTSPALGSHSTLGRMASGANQPIKHGSGDQIPQQVAEALLGHDTTVAVDARLRIDLTRSRIAAYRLLGHESPGDGLEVAAISSTLTAGQSAVVLFELWPIPGRAKELGTVQLSYRTPSGSDQQAWKSVTTDDFSRRFLAADPDWQAAVITAEAAETLREAPRLLFRANRRVLSVPRNKSLKPVIAAAESTPDPLRRRSDFTQMRQLLVRHEELRLRQIREAPAQGP